jgi:predicted phosphodiesterase
MTNTTHHGNTHPANDNTAHTTTKGYKGATFSKQRRGVGDPVSPAAEHARYIQPPAFIGTSLTLPLEAVLPGVTAQAKKDGCIVFHSLGDTGGIHGTQVQEAIAEAMEAQLKSAAADAVPRFFYHLGDVVYYNGQSENYISQFYEPYQYYDAPIFAIAGNHDGDTVTRRGDQPDNESTLFGFMENFCSPSPKYDFQHRPTMTQPYCYWKLEAPFVHVIGLYSNVDGLLDARGTAQQQNWLIDQLRAVPQDKWVIVAVHHPCYSLDAAHGGYEETLNALDAAFTTSGRTADAVLHGHVHNYQRFSRDYGDGKLVPFIIAGAGGYATSAGALHQLQKELKNKHTPIETTSSGVLLQKFDVESSGFLRLTADADHLVIDYFSVSFAIPAVVSSSPADTVKIAANHGKKSA